MKRLICTFKVILIRLHDHKISHLGCSCGAAICCRWSSISNSETFFTFLHPRGSWNKNKNKQYCEWTYIKVIQWFVFKKPNYGFVFMIYLRLLWDSRLTSFKLDFKVKSSAPSIATRTSDSAPGSSSNFFLFLGAVIAHTIGDRRYYRSFGIFPRLWGFALFLAGVVYDRKH